jgi:N-acyl-D-aspartate/D-glutamate deacylase
MGLAAAGKGVLQFVSDFAQPKEEFAMLRRIAEASGRPLSFSLAQGGNNPKGYRRLLDSLEDAVAAGLPMKAQVAARPVGVLLGLELTVNPFTQYPLYRPIAALPLAERVARLADPEFRARLLAGPPEGGARGLMALWSRMHPMGPEPDYEPTPETTVEVLAAARGVSPETVALDHMLTSDGRGMLYVPFLNYSEGSLDAVREMIVHPDSVPGLSDGGAHVGMICDGSFPTTMITHWTRDRARGPKIPLETVIRMQTQDTARAVGLHDRGVIGAGYRADLNVIDYEGLKLHAPQVVHDLPAGGRRLIQRASGYLATIVAGQVTYRDGEPTDALPGRLLRGARSGPVALAAE